MISVTMYHYERTLVWWLASY